MNRLYRCFWCLSYIISFPFNIITNVFIYLSCIIDYIAFSSHHHIQIQYKKNRNENKENIKPVRANRLIPQLVVTLVIAPFHLFLLFKNFILTFYIFNLFSDRNETQFIIIKKHKYLIKKLFRNKHTVITYSYTQLLTITLD